MGVACPDKFRGSLDAREAAAAIARGLRRAGFDEVREVPLADGGEGTLDALLHARGGARRHVRVTGPLGRPVDADYGLARGGPAVVEMARASGLALVEGANDPLGATTRGTGELIGAALRGGARSVLVAVGGSATTDGGLGAVEALGWSLAGADVVVACDVATPFLDAARVFGPQKGATPAQVELLTRRLESLAGVYRRRTGVDVTGLPGAGAAGGLAGGLAALGARLVPGFDAVAAAVGLDDALANASLVVTGEGRLDAASFAGKVVGGVVRMVSNAAVPGGPGSGAGSPRAAVIAGEVTPEGRAATPEGVLVESLVERAFEPSEAMSRAAVLLEEAAAAVGRWVLGPPTR